jgi:hypothetical protein
MSPRASSIKHARLAEEAIATSLTYSRVIHVAERGASGFVWLGDVSSLRMEAHHRRRLTVGASAVIGLRRPRGEGHQI